MNFRFWTRALATATVLGAAALLAGCNTDQGSLAGNAKASKPVPPKLVAEMQKKDMDLQSPILIRLFKQEAELEVWKQTRSGEFALLETYPICRWSGDLGPKVREGDRQAPEGFYSITRGQMNPQSAYYLSFNMGYPNAFDKALGRTGSQLMVHGDCSSRGCYAMTDEQISDIYALGRESFFGGQRAFQVQAYPFRMTPVNLAKHRNNPNMPFWKMIKVGYDHFEVTRREPKVDFCEKKYVFDAVPLPGSTRPLTFNPAGPCPAYTVDAAVADAVKAKERADDAKVAELVAKGTPVARLNTGIDGGMNKLFAAHVPGGAATGLSDPEPPNVSLMSAKLPGTIPSHVNPPRSLEPEAPPVVAETPAPATRMAIAAPEPSAPQPASLPTSSSGNFFSSLARRVGIGGAERTASTPAVERPSAAVAAKPPSPHPVRTVTPKHAAPKQVAAKPAVKPAATAAQASAASAAPATAPAAAFDSRFSAMR
ncbi:MAG: hypothetical protein M9932_14330 [Xanthobacteraceae bacterium]|nr:hypothetical protein [Xanthobacteraceae bacterium]